MADSAVPRLTEYVYDLLSGADLDAKVLWGPPLGDDRPEAIVSVGFGQDGQSGEADREWGPLGGGSLDEEIELELCIDVQGTHGPDLKPAYDRSYELGAVVEETLRGDLYLDELLLRPARLSGLRGRYYRADKTRGHRVFLTLTGSARI